MRVPPYRIDIEVKSVVCADIACELIKKGLGIPLGYIDQEDKLTLAPPPDKVVFAKAVMMLIDEPQDPSIGAIKNCLHAL